MTTYADERWKNDESARLHVPYAGQIRPLKFDENQDKSLLSELKHLYTAITRAKCNLWVYDTDQSKRLPVFDYWSRRKLVKTIDMTEHSQGDEIISQSTTTSEKWEKQGDYYFKTNGMTEHSQGNEIIFQNTTTSEQWEKQGDYYKEHGLLEQAASCYKKAELTVKQIQAVAYSNVAKASNSELSQSKISSYLEQAAHHFLLCDLMEHDTDHLVNACKCLQRIGHKEAALLHKKLAKVYYHHRKSYKHTV